MMLYIDLVGLLSPLLLPFLLATAGSPVSVFRPTGGSVTLEFQGHQQLEKKDVDYVRWDCSQETIIKYAALRDTVIVHTHKDRVEFNNQTFSLELKNLQKNDSGLYRGEISAGETEVKAEYRLSVLDPVESPVLSVVSNWSSCDSSNVTVTCRGRDLSLTSTCDCSTCSPEEEHSTNSNVILSVRGGKIICNHSNPVSWRNVTMGANQLCQLCSDTEQKVTPPGKRIWFILVVIPVCAGIALLIRRRLTAGVGQPQTESAEVMMSSAPGPPDSAGSTYSTVGPHQPPPPEENPYDEIPKEAHDEDRTLNLPRDSGSSGGVPQMSSAPGPPDSAGSPYSTVGLHQPPPPEENPYDEIPLEASSEDKTLSAPRGPSNNGEGATYDWKTEGTTPAPGPLVTSVYSTLQPTSADEKHNAETASAESTAASIVSSMQHPHQQTASAPGPQQAALQSLAPQAFMPE